MDKLDLYYRQKFGRPIFLGLEMVTNKFLLNCLVVLVILRAELRIFLIPLCNFLLFLQDWLDSDINDQSGRELFRSLATILAVVILTIGVLILLLAYISNCSH